MRSVLASLSSPAALAILAFSAVGLGGAGLALPELGTASARAFAAPEKGADAKDVLEVSRAAIEKARALSYTARAFSEGALAAGTPRHEATVTAVRADAGGWKIAARGSAATTAKDVTESAKLELGYDGATAWSLKEREKIAYTESIRKDADVEAFFKRNSAGPIVAWELFSEKPLALNGATVEGEGKAGGDDCVIVKAVADAGDGEGAATTRIFLSKKDNLPRRIERTREIKDTDGTSKSTTRVLEITNLKLDKDVAGVPFTLSAPEGYTIRTAGVKREASTGTDALRGPGVRDGAKKKGGSDGAMMADPSKRQAFPDFKLKDPAGKEHTLESYKGQIVVIDFWATWCGWCIKGMPDLQKVHDKYKGKDVKVVGINLFEEKPEDAVKFKKSKNYTYGLLLRGDDLGQKLKISGIPVIIVLDGEGKIMERIGGYDAKLQDRLSKLIDAELERTKKK